MHASVRPRIRGPLASAAVAAVLILGLSSCSGSGPGADLSSSRAVSFEATDGVHLEGRVFGEGPRGVVLSHMRPADQTSWYRFAGRLADDGYRVLTYDFRGYCPGGDGGCSEGEQRVADIWMDVEGAIAFLRGDGARSISLVGASMGGTASLIAAAQPGADVSAVITLSAPEAIEGLLVDPTVLTQITAGKLFIAGVGDAPAAASAESLYEGSPPPKRIEIVPADDHGTDLLLGARGDEVGRLIETYLETNGS